MTDENAIFGLVCIGLALGGVLIVVSSRLGDVEAQVERLEHTRIADNIMSLEKATVPDHFLLRLPKCAGTWSLLTQSVAVCDP